MIVREWRGATRATDREAYLAYLEVTGLRGYEQRQAIAACSR